MSESYPVFAVPEVAEDGHGAAGTGGYSAYFDFATGDFCRSGPGTLRRAGPAEAWKRWCLKTVYTERGAYASYSGGLGAELEQAMGRPDRAAREAAIERAISQALLADPYGRTQLVRDFTFAWSADGLEVGFTVSGALGRAELSAKL